MAKGKVFVDCRRTTIDCIGELMQLIAAGATIRSDIRLRALRHRKALSAR
ncbi:hypothetical protein [Mesorhizobium sp. M7D.F.Ca.US.004.03.1.1]|nr:hypothetical protein [Mesorhizobium sp. M7D.F.Ca.US.004.03.1.1]